MRFFNTRHIYTAALDALGKAKRPVEALNVFHAMMVMHVHLSLFSLSCKIDIDAGIWTTLLTCSPFLPATDVHIP